ncbi:hypothetical protein [Streptomyces sp. HB2AG]|uniref:hypothetical protein n=1 Tax=Streptomyces sp. HB2AG TaxID=2983400 RepID=UPI0022AA276C|nr:hypothetical protein [Streptomyces sp. HB2AG]MCZ2525176.1 hypothetical protein [Streptomyces sp. HB2AG]
MTGWNNGARAVWDPTADGGAGGWVRPAGPPDGTADRPFPSRQLPPHDGTHDGTHDSGRSDGGGTGPGDGDRTGPPRTVPPQERPPMPPMPPQATPAPPPYAAPPSPYGRPGTPHGQPLLPGRQSPYGQQFPHGQPGPAGAAHCGPGFPGPDAAPPGRGGPRRWALLAGAALLCAALGVGVVALVSEDDGGGVAASPTADPTEPGGTVTAPGGGTAGPGPSASPSPSPSPSGPRDAAGQAAALDALLEESSEDRQKVVDAVGTVSACGSASSLASARDDLAEAAEHRDDLVARLRRLDVSALEGGRDAVSVLLSAWRHSASADRAFADWADTAAGGACASGTAPQDADYRRGVTSSGKASAAKEAFVEQWNATAAEHGLEKRSADAF